MTDPHKNTSDAPSDAQRVQDGAEEVQDKSRADWRAVDDTLLRQAFEARSTNHHNDGCLKRGLSQTTKPNGYQHFDMNVEWEVWKDAYVWTLARIAQRAAIHFTLCRILQDHLVGEDECNSVDFEAVYSRKTEQELVDEIANRIDLRKLVDVTELVEALSELASVRHKLIEADAEITAYQLATKPVVDVQPVQGDMAQAVKGVRATEKALGSLIIGGKAREDGAGAGFLVQQLGYAVDYLERAHIAQREPIADQEILNILSDVLDAKEVMRAAGVVQADFPTMFADFAQRAPVADDVAGDLTRHPVVTLLLDVAGLAYDLMDGAEERGAKSNRELIVQHDNFSALSDAIDKLDALPDDQPDMVMGPAAKAAWALRPVADVQPADCKDCGDEQPCEKCQREIDMPETTSQPVAASVDDDAEFKHLMGVYADDEQARMRTLNQITQHLNAWGAQQREAGRRSMMATADSSGCVSIDGIGYAAAPSVAQAFMQLECRATAAEAERDELRVRLTAAGAAGETNPGLGEWRLE